MRKACGSTFVYALILACDKMLPFRHGELSSSLAIELRGREVGSAQRSSTP